MSDKKDFKRIRTTITKISKDLDSTKVRLDDISAFIDKVEYKLHEEVSHSDDDKEDYGW